MKLADVKQHTNGKEFDYDARLLELQYKALEIQRSYVRQGFRAVVVLEGWDAAGKGGLIRRYTEKLDPRSFRVHSIGAPNPNEQSIHYMYRFWRRVPPPSRIEIFDRSWYGRVLVERVEGFCGKRDWKRAYDEINQFEEMLAAENIRIIKIFLHISKKEQMERFLSRYENPRKRWKLTEEDFRNREKWDEYVEAIEDMVNNCSSQIAPWHIVGANSKRYTRLHCLELINEILSHGVDISPPPVKKGVEKWISKIKLEKKK